MYARTHSRWQLIVSLTATVAFFAVAVPVTGFDGHRVRENGVVLHIEGPEEVAALDKPVEVPVRVTNETKLKRHIKLQLTGLIDEFRAVGSTRAELALDPGKSERTVFRIAAGSGAETAFYPVRVHATFEQRGETATVKAVRVFRTQFPSKKPVPSKGLKLLEVPQRGALPLASAGHFLVSWNYLASPEEIETLPIGWQGQEQRSRATVSVRDVQRGETRRTVSIHPPYRPQPGTLRVSYRLQLPETTPLQLHFFNAIRDSHENEPLSDGVTFRVGVAADESPNSPREIVFERHTDSKRWLPGEVDLAPWAGETIVLELESHPGPEANTVCDSSHWGDPTIIAGKGPEVLREAQREELRQAALALLSNSAAEHPSATRFTLGNRGAAAVVLGPNGIADAAIAFQYANRRVAFDGMRIDVNGQPLGELPAGVICERVESDRLGPGRLKITHHLNTSEGAATLTAKFKQDRDALRLQLSAEGAHITDSHLGPANQKAKRLYYGHGYCIEEPGQFAAHPGGHDLSTSHVGMDFAQGMSLLVGSDIPVDRFEVNPENRLYALHAHPSGEFSFVPGAKGALDCAIRYRSLYRHEASPGVKRKAGRFVFDIWGGRYDETRRLMKISLRYGLRDSLLVFHNWQRWGYDYRLPDIYPPNPRFGTLEEMQQLAEFCREHDVPFAVHDNYIDVYPDAQDFSYEHVVFTRQGEPMKAWINQGREAQSYRWRPDRFQPFLERNLHLIKEGFHPTAYFVDVFASINSFDYYDRNGKFHSKLQTREHWGHAFDSIRETLGDNAPTISEAGSDHLIGHLDGSDCQFLQLSEEPLRFRHVVPCDRWTRVPWFDAVNHTRLSLHGVGYSSRYQAYRSRAMHGITSDDYISAEILTGHALMIDRQGMIDQAVRKYWLAQSTARMLAEDEIVDAEFVDTPQRQIIRWNSGATVYVNRGNADWHVDDKVLPQYGYCVEADDVTSSIERIEGQIVERSKAGNSVYVNGRGFSSDAPLKITPTAGKVQYLGDRRFRLLVDWEAEEPAPKDLTVFMHFFQPIHSRLNVQGFYGGGGAPQPGTSAWSGTITTGDDWTMTVPTDTPPGEYEILVGLFDRQSGSGRRYPLLGDDFGDRRYRIGKLVIEGQVDEITNIAMKKPSEPHRVDRRLLTNEQPTDFGNLTTRGAFRVSREQSSEEVPQLRVTPLPSQPGCSLTLDPPAFGLPPADDVEIVSLDASGKELRQLEARREPDGQITFQTRKGEFEYLLQ